MPPEQLIAAFITLFVVVDPIGLGPLFLMLTAGRERAERRKIASVACVIAAIVLVGAALFGEWLLRQLGIGLPAFRIAGGLLLFVIAFEMVFARRAERKAEATSEAASDETAIDIAAFPLAIPLMAGPGAITASLLLSGQTAERPLAMAMLLALIILVVLCCLVVFLVAQRLERFLGRTGQIVIARLLGVLLSALAVQFVIDGVTALVGTT